MSVALALSVELLGLFLTAGFVVGGVVLDQHLSRVRDMRQAAILHRVLPPLGRVGLAGGLLLLLGGLVHLAVGAARQEWLAWLLAEIALLTLLVVARRVIRARGRLLDHLAGGNFRRDAADRLKLLNRRYRVLLAGQVVILGLIAWCTVRLVLPAS